MKVYKNEKRTKDCGRRRESRQKKSGHRKKRSMKKRVDELVKKLQRVN